MAGVLSSIVLLTGAVLLWGARPASFAPDPGYLATRVLPLPAPVTAFELQDQHGRSLKIEQLYRTWSFVYPLPTRCDRPCRQRLTRLAAALEQWTEDEGFGNTQVLLLPEASMAPDALLRLAASSDRRFLGIVGSEARLHSLRSALFGDSWDVLALIDPLGRLRAEVAADAELPALLADYRTLRERYGAECCVSGDRPLEVVRFRGRDATPDQWAPEERVK